MNVPRWVVPSLMIVVAVLYARALDGPFQFDDWNVIVGDARVQSLAAWWDSMPGIRPLLKLSYALNFEGSPGPQASAAGFRAVNILLHAANAALAYSILVRFGGQWKALEQNRAHAVALCTALVFALHPVQTESVAYVSGRSSTLMGTFALSSILAWQLACRTERAAPRNLWQAVSAVCVLLACATRETAVVLPAALWLMYLCAERKSVTLRPAWQTLMLAPIALALALSPVYRSLLDFSLALRGPLENLLLVQPQSILYLLGQLLRFDRLNADPWLAPVDAWDAAAALRLGAAAALLLAGCVCLRRRPAIAFGVLWFFLWLAPTNSLIARSDLVNDRQLYLAILGPAWLLSIGLAALLDRWRRARWQPAASVLLAIVLASATTLRLRVYTDEIHFWRDVVAKSEQNPRAHNNLGIALAKQCRQEDARAEFRRALEVDPGYFLAAGNLELLAGGYFCTQAPASF